MRLAQHPVNLSTSDTPEAPEDPHLSDLVGFAEIARSTRLSYWTFHNAYRRGDIAGYPVPGGAVGLYRPDVERFVAAHRQKLAEKTSKKRAQADT